MPNTPALTCSRRVQWGDCDPAWQINSPRAFDYSVEMVEQFYRDVLGVSFCEMLEKYQIAAPVVHASCDFHAPLPEGALAHLALGIARLGRSSVEWRIEARRDGAVAFRSRMISSYVSLETREPVEIPEFFRARMEPFVGVGPAAD